jgi:4-amino-4-deoxychorismate lyase
VQLINGRPDDAPLATDRGLYYGDGLFETIAVENGIPRFWIRHINRLEQGCRRLGIVCPDPGLLRSESDEVLAAARSAVLKILVTRGAAGRRGYGAEEGGEPTRIVQRLSWPPYPAAHQQTGVAVRVCSMRLGTNPVLAGIKHLNRLEQVLARREWDDGRISEGLVMDRKERLVEGTMSNVFLVANGALLTPDLQGCGVAGIMRSAVMDLAAASGIDCHVCAVDQDMLARADEVFLTNSLIGIWPVYRVDSCGYDIGPVTRALQKRLASGDGEGTGWYSR